MTGRRLKRFRDVLSRRQPDLTVVVENVHDPHNVGAILRSADAVGAAEIQLVYNVESFPRLGKKSSASANKWIVSRRFRTIRECYDELRSKGFSIYATHLSEKAVSLYDLDLTRKVALVFGNEHRGVSAEAAREADVNFQIPMSGMIRSLNVSVACAVSLYEAFRQRMARGRYRRRRLPSAEFDKLLAEWTRTRP